jgi:hypothetical protein
MYITKARRRRDISWVVTAGERRNLLHGTPPKPHASSHPRSHDEKETSVSSAGTTSATTTGDCRRRPVRIVDMRIIDSENGWTLP